MPNTRTIFALFLTTLVAAQGQPSFIAVPSDPSVPTPERVLRYGLGERFTDVRNLERYLDAVDRASDRVSVVEYGTTYELRPLRVAVITSPANHARLDSIRAANLRLTDPRRTTAPEAAAIGRWLPAIVWFSFGVHGNESSSPEAAIALLYRLAAGTDEQTLRLLDRAVVLIDPSLNPDGRERFVRWMNGIAQSPPNPDPAAAEHAEPWPGGRTNHYYFDLNRDWSWLTQTESRSRAALYQQWMPHVHVDFHEMGHESSYFFFPASKPFHETLPPSVGAWGAEYGRANARALDSIGSAYYTAERFDMFYPGYGDSWPTFNGGIGMTYEQAGSGRAGLTVDRTDGSTLTLLQRVRNHYTTGMATLETTVRMRERRIADFADFWRSALSPAGGRRLIVVPSTEDAPLRTHMTDILLAQGIEVHALERETRLPARPFYSSASATTTFGEGSIVVALHQPRGRLATALLEPKSAVRDTFFYDVSAWSLPVAFGLRAFEVSGDLPPSARQLGAPPPLSGGVSGPTEAVALVVPPGRSSSTAFVIALLKAGVPASVSHRPVGIGDRTFPAGSIVVRLAGDGGSVRATVSDLAFRHGVEVFSFASAWTEDGLSIGSDHVRTLRLPSIAVATGDGISPGDYGELWYLLEQELGLPFTAVDQANLSSVLVDKYDVLVLPDGYAWGSKLDSTAVRPVRDWVQKGGTVIAIERAARQLLRSKSGLTSAQLVSEADKGAASRPDSARKERQKTMTRFEKEEADRLDEIPGTIFRVMVDTTHPIGFGTSGSLYVLKGNEPPLALSADGHTAARFTPDTLQVSGYLPAGRGRAIAGSAFAQEFRVGQGRVVLFAEPMTFRMFWRGPARLLTNALLYVPPPRRP